MLTRLLVLGMLALGSVSTAYAGPPESPSIFFATGNTSFSMDNDHNKMAFNKLVKTLKENDNYNVLLVGVADAQGDAKTNKALALKRAEYVRDKVVEQAPGMKKRIRVHSLGEKPAKAEDKRGKRKVVMMYFKPKGQPAAEIVEDYRKRQK